jgi:glycosyltransferase involved in cell wall biosynthesis
MTHGRMPRLDSLALVEPRRATEFLRVGINLVVLSSNGGGMRQYVLQLLPWMLRQSPHHFVVYYHWRSQPSLATILRRLTPSERNRLRLVLVRDHEEIFAHADEFDVFFCPLNCLAPDLLDRPTLVTLPDIQERFYPHYFTREQLYLRDYFYPFSSRAVTTLLTLSEFSKRTICDNFGVPPSRVRAIHLASNDEVRDVRPEWPAALGELPERYVFYPANLYPHKNHRTLLDAIVLLGKRGIACSCVMTGQPSQPGINIEEEIRARGLEVKARWLGHVAPGTLRYLYEHAITLCFPSEFEGFGMPIVEAMECGCPVIATAVASIPEIAGEAAQLIDGTPQAFADAIAHLLAEPRVRQEMIARGRSHCRRFNPRRLARETLQAIEEAAVRFWQPAAPPPEMQTISYVVRALAGGEALMRTLASLAYEIHDHDEILILLPQGAAPCDTQSLADNLRIVRYLPDSSHPAAWIDEVRGDHVIYLHEGDWISEGATRTALATFTEGHDCDTVVGQVLMRDISERLVGVAYLPPRPRLPASKDETAPAPESRWRVEGKEPPAPAVLWRTEHLRRYRHLLSEPSWILKALEEAGPRARECYRTFASSPAPRPPLGLPPETWVAIQPQLPGLKGLARRARSLLGKAARKMGLRPPRKV